MKNIQTLPKLLLIFSLFLTAPTGLTLAHGEDGLEFTAQADGYTADMDYAARVIEAGGSTGRFSFSIFADEARSEGVEFTDLWVTITQVSTEEGKRDSTIFAGPINKPDFGATGFTYAFYEAGPYVVSVRYMNEGEKITQVEFPIEVIEVEDVDSGNSLGTQFFIGVVAGLLVGILGTAVVLRRKNVVVSDSDSAE